MGPLPKCIGLGLMLILQFDNAQFTMAHTGCPEGSFALDGLQRCFTVLNDVRRTWFEANYKCESLDLRMAKPTSSAAAIALRKNLLETYGDGTFWLGAKADGAQYAWVDDSTPLSNTDPLRIPGYSGIHNDNHCLALAVNQNSTTMHPNSPYTFGRCSWRYATLCEAVIRAVCPAGCVNGQCTSHFNCTCTPGYTGNSCNTSVCNGGCGKGQCISPNKCKCFPGNTGDTCDTPICRYTGDNCDTRCEHGWHLVGSQCLTWVRQNRNGTDAKAHCANMPGNASLAQPDDILALHMYMKKKRELVGKLDYAWYVGAEIATPGAMTWYSRGMVPAKYQDNPNAGTDGCIVLTWTDRYTPFLRSIRCSTRRWHICGKPVENIIPTPTVPKLTTASPKTTTPCPHGYTGQACETPICPGECGNGQCTSPNKCTCKYGYTGSTCNTQIPPPTPAVPTIYSGPVISPVSIQIKYILGDLILRMAERGIHPNQANMAPHGSEEWFTIRGQNSPVMHK